jgi:small subunit ribosomal protein S1
MGVRSQLVKIEKPKSKMEELLEKGVNVFKVGDTVEAKIFAKTKNKLWVDTGVGIGVVPEKELTAESDEMAKGDKVLAYVLKPEDEEGNIILSLRRADKDKIWDNLKIDFEDEKILKGRIMEANKGGLMVEVNGVRGFLPVSQLAPENYPRVEGGDKNKILEKLRTFINKNIQVKIISFDKEAGKLIFSEKAVQEETEKAKISQIKIGQKVEAIITGVVDFGLFVRFKPKELESEIEGLIHISEVSWDRVTNLKKNYSPGDKVEAEIISVEGNRVSLSLKRLIPDPWLTEVKKYQVGDISEGEVTRVTPFGAFVRLDRKIEGLVHISEMSEEQVIDPREILSPGDKKDFKIISVEPEAHKIGLSLKGIENKTKGKKPKPKMLPSRRKKGKKNSQISIKKKK